jgi:hypothetical protein
MACLFALAVPALAAPDTVTVTAQAPADWAELYIHFWGGAEASTWPGEVMTPVDGRFTFDIPADSTGLLVHNNQGRQSQDLALTGDPAVWVVYDGGDKTGATLTPTDPGKQNLGTVTPPTETPAPILPDGDKVKVHTYVPEGVSPRLWAWQDAEPDVNAFQSWPGEPFQKDGKWWTIEMPAACNAIIVNDGTDSKKTGDTTVEAGKELWAVVQYDWTVEIFYSEPNLDDIVTEAPPISENPMFSRPTLGEVKDDVATTAPTTAEQVDEPAIPKKTQAIIVIGTAVLAIIAIAFVLSIPKKIK